jgi:four helix bundle protein
MKPLTERTFAFAVCVVRLCVKLKFRSVVSSVLIRQLLKAGTSIGANIEEGQGSQSQADFLSKYSIAHKEARETRYWLRLLRASELVSFDSVADLLTECNELIAILTVIIKKLRAKLGK